MLLVVPHLCKHPKFHRNPYHKIPLPKKVSFRSYDNNISKYSIVDVFLSFKEVRGQYNISRVSNESDYTGVEMGLEST